MRKLAAVVVLPFALAACGGGGGSDNSANPPVETIHPKFVPITRTYEEVSSSMEPTLHCARPGSGCEAANADQIVVKSFDSSPGRTEILAFESPPDATVKCGSGGVRVQRVIGLPSETIQEKSGTIYIDGHELVERYVTRDRRDSESDILGKTKPYRIPAGMYFFMGDNRIQSCDSREWGPVPRASIVGRVVKIRRPG